MRKADLPNQPRWKRVLKSVGRIFQLLFLILFFCGGGAYCWNPQKIHLFKKKPMGAQKVDPDSATLFSKGHRVTIVVGHPDDAEFFISGALCKLDEAGAKLTLIVVTDGDKSFYPPFTTNVEENRKVRHAEQIEASSGYHANVVFLGGPDGRYDPDEPNLRAKLKAEIDKTKPETLIAFEPEYLPTVQHRDHENSGRATLELAKNTSASWILLFASTANNFYTDTSKYWDKRAELVAVHKSQVSGEKLEWVRGTLLDREMNDGVQGGCELAEGFRAVKLKD